MMRIEISNTICCVKNFDAAFIPDILVIQAGKFHIKKFTNLAAYSERAPFSTPSHYMATVRARLYQNLNAQVHMLML